MIQNFRQERLANKILDKRHQSMALGGTEISMIWSGVLHRRDPKESL